MRWILLLISTGVVASAQDCGPQVPSCSINFSSPVVGSPCWLMSENGDRMEYCHMGKNLTIATSDAKKSANIRCDGEILECSWLPNINLAKGGQLSGLNFYNCGMNESISCVLRALNAKGLTNLFMYYWGTEITAENLRGLDGLTIIIVNESEAITKLPVEGLKQLPALHTFRMSKNSITSIPADAFSELTGLKFIELTRTKITELQSGAFEGAQGLINLHLFKNEIKTVHEDALKGLPSLDTLDLQDNTIVELPAGMFSHTPDLRSLDIRRNRAGLRLRKVALAGLTKLETFWLTMYDKTRLSLEDQALSNLPSLTFCDLSEAGIEELPAGLFKGTKSLVELKLNGNEIRFLPENVFEDLVNLTFLSLSDNKLEGELADYSSPYVGPFSTTGKLEILNLSRNKLQNISMQFFKGASSLKNLDLSNNQLNFNCQKYLPVDTGNIDEERVLDISPLVGLNGLETLNLSHNNLTGMCDDFMTVMTILQHLDLSHNKLLALTWDDISFFANGIIDLRYNEITSIRIGSRPEDKVPNVTLLLGNNPFICDCRNFRMLREFKNEKYDLSGAYCSEPEPLKQVPLMYIAEASNSYSLDNLTCILPDTPKNCECIVRPSTNMTECVCDEVVTTLPDPSNIAKYSFIDQQITTKYNMFLKLKTIDKLENMPNFVTNLSLTNLALETIPSIPEHIRYIDLTYNNLEEIPYDLLSRNLTFNLTHNPFKCTCAAQTAINNLQKYKIKINDYSNLLCQDSLLVENIQVPHLCDFYNYIIIAIIIATLGVLFGVLLILAYKYQLEIRIWLYNQGWTFGLFNYEKALDASKKYDIFLSYCHEDEDYVVNELLPFMDPKYSVCVHTRDFMPGEDIMTQIYRAVADSRRTVIVASKAYFKSPWCLEEMRAAYKQTEVDQRLRAVVILRTDVDPKSEEISETIRSYLNLNTWIAEKDQRFWYRLCYFLPRDVTAEDLRLIKVTMNAKKNLSGQLNKVFVNDGKFGIDNETGEVNGNLARNLCGVKKTDNVNDEVQLAINNLPGGLDAVCNNGKLANNLPETLNVVHNDDGKLVNVDIA